MIKTDKRTGNLRVGLYLARGAAAVTQACAGVSGIDVEQLPSAAALQAKLDDFDAIIIQNTVYSAAFAERVAAAGRLHWIQAAASGIDAFHKYGLPRHVALSNAGDTWAPCVADHAMALVLGLARGIPAAEKRREQRHWDQQGLGGMLLGLRGRTLLVVGLGAIGNGIARRAEAFGMKVDAVTRSPDKAQGAAYLRHVFGTDKLEQGLKEADVVVLSLPLTPDSAKIINRQTLATMKRTALLINVSRGGVIDEAALLEALTAGHLAGVGLDVAETEPLPSDNPLWNAPRTCITPHVAAFDDGPGFELLGELCRENLVRFRDEQPLKNGVSLGRGDDLAN